MTKETMAGKVSEESFFIVQMDSSGSVTNTGSLKTAAKKKNKKGGLSMFLSGALDDTPKEVAPPPPTPKSEGPAWGGAKISKGSASLREIQDEQSKMQFNCPVGNKNRVKELSKGKVLLSSLLPSKPIPVSTVQTSQTSDGEKNTPPWASGTPPHLSRPSLRDIQMQQVCEFEYPLPFSLASFMHDSRKGDVLNKRDPGEKFHTRWYLIR